MSANGNVQNVCHVSQNEVLYAYQFKVCLKRIKPMIWRRIQMPENATFKDLHRTINIAMGWKDAHLHSFTGTDPRSGNHVMISNSDVVRDCNLIGDAVGMKDSETPIRDFFFNTMCRFEYIYDFGDEWAHDVRLEKITHMLPNKNYPMCLAGRRACPPEDCGGAGGYMNLLNIISDTGNEEHESMLNWLKETHGSEHFDPEKFDVKSVSDL